MTGLPRGLYEVLLTAALENRLNELGDEPRRDELRPAEAPDRLALHLGELIRKGLEDLPEDERVAKGLKLASLLIEDLARFLDEPDLRLDVPAGKLLQAVEGRKPDGTRLTIPQPLIPLLDTTLLTNSPGEPRLASQVLAEIQSADRIDIVMAFIRMTGIRPLLEALRRHCDEGKPLRILTTIFTGSTEPRALEKLRELGGQVRVSYDTTGTRLHAKAWLFKRLSGFSTAYIGSSNLTHSGQESGLEWNVRVSTKRNPDVLEKVGAVFDSYWNGGDFLPYDAREYASRLEDGRQSGPLLLLSPMEIKLEPFQERLLEHVALSRERGHHRNLLASATGTGKTVMAAVDYARLREALSRSRLLFVAHREEILEQSRRTFAHCLRDPAFGELWVGGRRPARFEHVFASIQSLCAAGLADIDPRHFDVVIVDEFHHAAAPSYEAVLRHIQPIELLGLTATPERSDGLPVLQWFDGRIAAELRLWDAIEQHRLSPFAYYGVFDGMDLRQVAFRRGTGYDVDALTQLLTADDIWARQILASVEDRVADPRRMRALGFCVGVEHARFMKRVFCRNGIQAAAVSADTPDDERRAALDDLRTGRIQIVFSVDLFNEGVDLPDVDTVLFLRPTDSPTLFLQQLGRGLRKSKGKGACTVLDFVGHHNKDFRFDRRFRALLGGSRKDLERQIQGGFPFLPAGCHLELDRLASEIVLQNVRQAVPNKWTAKVEELRNLLSGGPVGLQRYLEETGLDLEDLYAGSKSWTDCLQDAGAPIGPAGPAEASLRRACGRLLHVDDPVRLDAYRKLLASSSPPELDGLPERERRLVRMLVASLADQAADGKASLKNVCDLVWAHPQVRAELMELFDLLSDRVEHTHRPLPSHPDVPLQVHARYTRLEIFGAFGIGDRGLVPPWQTGCHFAKEAAADLFAFTLDKTRGQFSPTTRYRDYAISRELIHWETQSITRAESETGKRYCEHAERGHTILLFSRLRTDDRAFWFLGPATYVSHQGERPMAITWRLEHSLPGDLFASFAAAVA